MLTPELNVISVEEETELLNALVEAENKGTEINNRIAIRYGNSIYGNSELKPIPDYLLNLCNKLIDKKILNVLPEDISINIYYPGNKMLPHIDKIDAGPVITILSLLSDANLILSYGSKKEIVLLPSRSVVQLKDKYRTHWKHSIEEVNDKRISIVFRQLGKNN
jgi:alkylated DNA repair dioxygenase AlkB